VLKVNSQLMTSTQPFMLSPQIWRTHLEFCTASKLTLAQRYNAVAMTTSSPRHMHTDSVDDYGQNGGDLRSSAVRQHDMKDERDPKEASEMMNTQDTLDQDTRNVDEMKLSLDTRDPIRAILDIVSDEQCLS
jgi:hypothetical protein